MTRSPRSTRSAPFAAALVLLAAVCLGACAPEAKAQASPAGSASSPAPATLPAPGGLSASVPAADERYRDPAALAALLAEGEAAGHLRSSAGAFLLLDVRTEAEFAAGHIPGALLLPYDAIAAAPPAFPKDGLVIVYCRSGNRSAQAKATLQGLGWTRVVDFGGLSRWTGPLAK